MPKGVGVQVPPRARFALTRVRDGCGLERAISVWVDADRLAAYQIPITAVRDAIVRQNADLPGGNVTEGAHEAALRTMGRILDPKAFDDLVIATIGGVPVRVRDVGRAEDGTKEQRSIARLDGVPTVTLEVRRQSGANTVAVIDAVAQIAYGDKFNIWAGRFLPPSERANLYGPYYSNQFGVYTDGIQDGYPFETT